MELTTKCVKIYPRKNVTWGLMCENLAARKYLRLQYAVWDRHFLGPLCVKSRCNFVSCYKQQYLSALFH